MSTEKTEQPGGEPQAGTDPNAGGQLLSYDALSAELETLAKSMSAGADDDKKIRAAAGEDVDMGMDPAPGDAGGAMSGEGKEDMDEPMMGKDGKPMMDKDGKPMAKSEKPMAKSFTFTDADGEQREAIDATDLVKSLQDQVAGLTNKVEAGHRLHAQQNDLLKSLNARLDTLANAPAGRKSSLTIADKPSPMTPSTPAKTGLTGGEVMAKCLQAQRAGRLTGQDVSIADVSIRNGQPVPAAILAVLAE